MPEIVHLKKILLVIAIRADHAIAYMNDLK